MIIQTPIFGEVEVDREKCIRFDKGIPGFAEEKEFVFLDYPETPFTIMQSITSELNFFLIRPFEFFSDYEIKLPDSTVESLGISRIEDVVVYNIVTIQDNILNSTANMQAPVVVNLSNCKGKQVVLTDSNYLLRQAIFKRDASSAITHE